MLPHYMLVNKRTKLEKNMQSQTEGTFIIGVEGGGDGERTAQDTVVYQFAYLVLASLTPYRLPTAFTQHVVASLHNCEPT